ncbi:MAG: tetratricopeptide repeat protein [Pseudolabrys sp.]
MQTRSYARAIDDLDRVIQIEPKNAQAYYQRGFAFERSGQRTKAIDDYTAALARDGSMTVARDALVHVTAEERRQQDLRISEQQQKAQQEAQLAEQKKAEADAARKTVEERRQQDLQIAEQKKKQQEARMAEQKKLGADAAHRTAERSSTGAGQHAETPSQAADKNDVRATQVPPAQESVQPEIPLPPLRKQATLASPQHNTDARAVHQAGRMTKSVRPPEHNRRATREAEQRRRYYLAQEARRQAYYAYYYEMRRRYQPTHRGLLFTDIWNGRP